jgi:hypothetical protein
MVLTGGITRGCKDNLGGISQIWLFPFVRYNRSQIITNENVLVTFPSSTIYRFDFLGDVNVSETMEENEGGKFYNISIPLQLTWRENIVNIEKFLKRDFRIIALDRNGKYRLFGVYVGLLCESLTFNTGSSKTDFNGFNLTFTGQEDKQSLFINDLEEAGFSDADFRYRITQTGEFRITENDNFRILQ